MSVNKIFLLGNLGHTPTLSYTASGVAVSRISMATSRKYVGADGQINEETEWHQVIAYGRQAEVIHEYVKRGNRLWVEGHIRSRNSTGRDGVERRVTEIIADKVSFFQNTKEAQS